MYEPAVVSTGHCVHLAGQTARRGETLVAQGIVGDDVDIEAARACARQCVDNLLAHLLHLSGGAEKVARVVKINVYVAATAAFADHSAVADAASERLHEALGDYGGHARSAIGVASLPRQSPVEIDAVIEIEVPATPQR